MSAHFSQEICSERSHSKTDEHTSSSITVLYLVGKQCLAVNFPDREQHRAVACLGTLLVK